VLYLPFDLDDGPYARDRSGYSNHGTIYGATRVAGKTNRALDFDGVDDYVEVGHDVSLNPTELTIMCWVYRKGLGTGSWQLIAGKYPYPAAGGYGIFFRQADERVYFFIRESPVLAYSIVDTVTLATYTWIHYEGTFDGSTMKLYRNGSLVDSTSATLTATTEPVYIGAWKPYGGYFQGVIDEARIYNRVLSQSEIKRLMYMRGV